MSSKLISSQVINTMQQSNEPWAIKDKNSCWIFGNLAFRQTQNLPDLFDYEGKYDSELPWSGAEFTKEFVIHDKSVMKQEKRICSLETHTYGKDKFLSSYFSEKYPIYNDENECIGLFLHAWKAQDFSLTQLFHGKLPASIMFQPPTDLFTQREWDVIFLMLQKHSSKQTGKVLNISYRTVETHISRIYGRIGVHSSDQLEEYCRTHDYHLYMPKKFIHPKNRVFL